MVTILNSKTKFICKDWPNFVFKFDLLKVFLWLTKDEKQTLTYFRMCTGKAVHVLQLKPTQLVWCGVVWCGVVWYRTSRVNVCLIKWIRLDHYFQNCFLGGGDGEKKEGGGDIWISLCCKFLAALVHM